MATAKNRSIGNRRRWPRIALVLALIAGAGVWHYRAEIAGYGAVGTAYGARMACSCRYVAGRPVGDCKKDFEPGMQFVFLSDDADEKSVTAYIPLVASDTARFRQGYGCVLDSWHR